MGDDNFDPDGFQRGPSSDPFNDSGDEIQRRITQPPSNIARRSGSGVRNFRCPRCDGEFNSWNRIGDRLGSVDTKRKCPFCDLERGSYDPEEAEQ